MGLTLEERTKNFIDKLKVVKEEEYELLGGFTKQREDAEFLHKKCGHKWITKPIYLMRAKGTLGCPKCQYLAKASTLETFQENLDSKYSGEFSITNNSVYVNNRVDIEIKHKCGFVFKASPTTLLVNGSCPECRKNVWNGKTTEEFSKELETKHSGEYKLVEGSEYRGANEKVLIAHMRCNYVWEVRASHILHRSGCPSCNESKGEKLIADILERNGIKFGREVTFDDCVNTKKLPFDFVVLDESNDIKCLIEYDGSQHFESFTHFGGDEKLARTQKNDIIKNEYCKNNNIPLLRIKYDVPSKDIEKIVKEFLVGK